MTRLPLAQWKEPKTCQCDVCLRMCKKAPCFPTPAEARKLIQLGYGPKLMLNFWDIWDDDAQHNVEVMILSPARKGAEGGLFGDLRHGCTLQENNGNCSVHRICKPIEGRLAICQGREPIELRERVVALWNNRPAQTLAKQWVEQHGRNKKRLREHIEISKEINKEYSNGR